MCCSSVESIIAHTKIAIKLWGLNDCGCDATKCGSGLLTQMEECVAKGNNRDPNFALSSGCRSCGRWFFFTPILNIAEFSTPILNSVAATTCVSTFAGSGDP